MPTPPPTALDLTGRVAIITGAGGGFGHAIAHRLAAAGGKLALWDHNGEAAAALSKDLPQSIAMPVDVTSDEQVSQAARAVFERFGQIDILINNAGILGPLTTTWNYSEEEFRRVVDVNLIGPFLCVRHIIPFMQRTPIEQRYGRIVNVASIQAKEGMDKACAYSASKAGLVSLTKTLGRELAKEGILVNCITPAASMTPMSQAAPADRIADIVSRIPMGRLLEPDEVAAMVLWLCSAECSFSTGAVFDLSGGRATY